MDAAQLQRQREYLSPQLLFFLAWARWTSLAFGGCGVCSVPRRAVPARFCGALTPVRVSCATFCCSSVQGGDQVLARLDRHVRRTGLLFIQVR